MSDDRSLDEKIARLIRSVDEQVPPALEERIHAAAETLRPHRIILACRWPRILVLVPGAAAVVLAVFLVLPALRESPGPRISEIRTEFEIADKNIKIIFIQKPDFKLIQEE